MKKIFLVIAFISAGLITGAQAKFGAKAGLNLADWSGSDADETKMKIGFHLGGFVNLAVSETFSVQPELLFSNQGTKFETEEGSATYHTNYLNIPVMAQYTTASGFYAETGPYAGFLLSAKIKSDGQSADVKELFKSADFGWGLGLGYKLSSGLGFGARYNFGLAKLPEEGDAKLNNSVIHIGLSYTFGGK
ncbi:MAG TPA: porin family protein [Chitinophagaceae bacterium]|nr:porin family protein [Chitinophagaceae bacterium]